jgi:hypothetical protein
MIRARLRIVGCWTALLLSGCSGTGEGRSLRYEAGEGRRAESLLSFQAVSTMRMIAAIQFSLDFNADLLREGLEPDGGNGEMSRRVRHTLQGVETAVTVDQTMFGAEDIDRKMQETAGEISRRYSGMETVLRYRETGQFAGSEGELLNAAYAADDELAAQNLEQLLGSNFAARLAALQPVFPPGPLHPGDTWTAMDTQDVLGIPVILTNTYTLTEWKGGQALLQFSGTYSMDTLRMDQSNVNFPFSGVSLPESESLRVLLKGTQQGNASVEIDGGWVRECQLKQQLEMEFRMGVFTLPVQVNNTLSLQPKK